MLSIGGYHYTLIPALVLLALLAYASLEALRGRIKLAKRVYRDAAIAAAIAWVIYTVPYVTHDYTLKPVYESTSVGLPWWLLPATAWSTGGGSLFLFAVIAAIGGYLIARSVEHRWYLVVAPWVAGIVVIDAWLYGAFDLNPHPEPTGLGLNPLLKSFWIYPHPLTTFGGYALLAVAALALAMGIRNRSVYAVYSVGWGMLTLGIMLGGLWSYETFGWGGYWAWDPVETSELMVWLAATTIPHVLVAAEALAPSVSALTISTVYLAMFVTRGGLSALHSFALPDLAADILLAVSLAGIAYAIYKLVFVDVKSLVASVKKWPRSPMDAGMGVATVALLYSALLLTAVLLVASVRAALGLPASVPQMDQGVEFFNPRLYPAAFLLLAGIIMTFLGGRLGWRGVAALLAATGIVAGVYAWYAWQTLALAPLSPRPTNAVMAAGIVFSSAAAAATIVYVAGRVWRNLRRPLRILADRYIGVTLVHLGFAIVLLGVFMGGTYSFNRVYSQSFTLHPGDSIHLPGGRVLTFESYKYGVTWAPVDIYTLYVCRAATYYAAQDALLYLHFDLARFYSEYVRGERMAATPPYSTLLSIIGRSYAVAEAHCTNCNATVFAFNPETNTTLPTRSSLLNITVYNATLTLRLGHVSGFHGEMQMIIRPAIDARRVLIEGSAVEQVARVKRAMLLIRLAKPLTLHVPHLGVVNVTSLLVSGRVEATPGGVALLNATGEAVDAVLAVNGTVAYVGRNHPLPLALLVYLALRDTPYRLLFDAIGNSTLGALLENPSDILRLINTTSCPGHYVSFQGVMSLCRGFVAAPRYVPENSYLVARLVVRGPGGEATVNAKIRFEVNGEVQGIHGSVPKVLHAPIGLTDVYITVQQPLVYAPFAFQMPDGSVYQPSFPDLVVYYLHEVFKKVRDPGKRLALAALLAAGLDIDTYREAAAGKIPEQSALAQIEYDTVSLYLMAENYTKPGVVTEGLSVEVKLVPGAPLVWWGSALMAAAAMLSALAVYVPRREGRG